MGPFLQKPFKLAYKPNQTKPNHSNLFPVCFQQVWCPLEVEITDDKHAPPWPCSRVPGYRGGAGQRQRGEDLGYPGNSGHHSQPAGGHLCLHLHNYLTSGVGQEENQTGKI